MFNVPMYPLQYSIIDTVLLVVLSLGEAHALILGVTMLVGEYYHEILAREVLLQFVRQSLQRRLIRYGTLTGCHYHKQMVVVYLGSQLWQLVPVGHVCVLGTHVGMTVIDIFADKCQTLVAPMELYAAVQLTCKTAQSLQPAMESRLKLSSRWHSHTYAA